MIEALKEIILGDLYEEYAPYLEALLPKYEIDTDLRQRHFLAQVLHESGGFKLVRENLNYSAEALVRTWPSIFTPDVAVRYARQPEKIANRVYSNRMGNGTEASGDGWKYIGRGLIQTTGKDNYRKASMAIFGDDSFLYMPEMLEQPKYAVESACVYWKNNNLNWFADMNDLLEVTRRINGGYNGLDDRKRYFNLLGRE